MAIKLDAGGQIHCDISDLEELQRMHDEADRKIEEMFKDSPKRGHCTLTKVNGVHNERFNPGYTASGYCPGIVVGLSCRVDNVHRWFMTSVVTSIDWEKEEFTTLNSIYKFHFDEDNSRVNL